MEPRKDELMANDEPIQDANPDGVVEPFRAALAAVQMGGCEATRDSGLAPYNAVRYVPIALDAIPDGWAKVEGAWVRLVQFDASCEADGVGGHWHVDPEFLEG